MNSCFVYHFTGASLSTKSTKIWNVRGELSKKIISAFVNVKKCRGGKMTAQCKHCDPGANPKTFSKGNLSNLKTHLRRVHPELFSELIDEAKKEKKGNQDEKLQSGYSTELEEAVLKFIVKERLPLSKLDSCYMNNLINGEFQVGSW